jgi:hypothetical protein
LNALKQWKLESRNGEFVFANSAGSIRQSNRIHESCWTPLQIKCGLVDADGQPKYSFHKLRHAAASMFIQYLGWTPKRLQAVMGHASVRLTFDLYGHLFENIEADREAMAKIENAKKPIDSTESKGLTRRCPARQAITAMAKPCRSITGDTSKIGASRFFSMASTAQLSVPRIENSRR